jgi:hypothetical protein
MKAAISILLIIMALGMAGCAVLSPEITSKAIRTGIAQTLTARPPTEPPPPSNTPTSTQIPTDTSEPTLEPITDSATNVATVIADPEPDFNQAYIYGVAHLGNGHFLVTIEIPGSAGNLKEKYTARLADESLRCIILEEYPNRLYCNGPTENAGKYVNFQLINMISNEVVFENQIGVPPSPYISNPGPLPTKKSTDADNSGPPTPTPAPSDTPSPPYPYP